MKRIKSNVLIILIFGLLIIVSVIYVCNCLYYKSINIWYGLIKSDSFIFW